MSSESKAVKGSFGLITTAEVSVGSEKNETPKVRGCWCYGSPVVIPAHMRTIGLIVFKTTFQNCWMFRVFHELFHESRKTIRNKRDRKFLRGRARGEGEQEHTLEGRMDYMKMND